MFSTLFALAKYLLTRVKQERDSIDSGPVSFSSSQQLYNMNRIEIREELIEVKNKLEELIKQLSAETEATLPMEEALENIIFNVRLFSTPEKLAQLKRTIGNFISWNPIKDERKIDAQTMNQFFCLYAALWSRPNVLANASLADFVRQMALWFPQWIPQDTDKKKFGRFTKALSAEQSHWKDENGKLKKVTEWKKFIQENKMKSQKTTHFERVAMEIYLSVNQLVKGW